MRKFDFFEFVGFVVPGAIFLWGLGWAIPQVGEFFFKDVDLLKLGYFLVFAYGGGHVIQSLGSILEKAWWRIRGGRHTDIMRKVDHKRYPSEWRDVIVKSLGIEEPEKDIPLKMWRGYVAEIRAEIVKREKCYERAYFFLGNRHMFRGMATAVLFVSGVEVFNWLKENVSEGYHLFGWNPHLGFLLIGLVIAFLCFFSMNRFGRHYAKEMFAQYVTLKKEEK